MVSAGVWNAQHASGAASRAAMRERFERTVTLFSPDDLRPHLEEGASSAFTRVVDALLAPVSKDGGGPMLRDGGFRRLLSMRPNVARAGEDTPDRNAGPAMSRGRRRFQARDTRSARCSVDAVRCGRGAALGHRPDHHLGADVDAVIEVDH